MDPSYEVYLALYQAVSGTEEQDNVYKQLSRDFFDLVVIDECHRGSAREDSAWREILEYFDSAIQLGLTATPKETKDVSTLSYFGAPLYTYSLKEGIADGFLAPYKVVRIDLDRDLAGWRPSAGMTDDLGQVIDDRIYNQRARDGGPPSPAVDTGRRRRRPAEVRSASCVDTKPCGEVRGADGGRHPWVCPRGGHHRDGMAHVGSPPATACAVTSWLRPAACLAQGAQPAVLALIGSAARQSAG